MGDTTGQSVVPTGTDPGGGSAVAPAALVVPVVPAPAAGVPNPQQTLEAQLAEQKAIQSGLDKRVAQLMQQVATTAQEKKELADRLAAAGQTGQELELLRQKVAASDGERTALEQQVAAAKTQAERVGIVASEFPALAPLVAAGALPEAKDNDEFRAKLKGMAEAFSANAQVQFQTMAAGARPPASPPAGTPGDPKAIQRDMLAALRDNDFTKYNTLKEQWYAATAHLTK